MPDGINDASGHGADRMERMAASPFNLERRLDMSDITTKETMNRLTVHEDGQPIYDIVMTEDFSMLSEEVEKLSTASKRLCIVTDSNVAELYLDEVTALLAPICRKVISYVFPAGEANKNLNTVQKLYETLILNQFDRGDMLVALGGGVVGDLCGFAAATYLRGISFIQIPTTLLSQVDSSIGGKTGVDFDAYKNMVGAFHMPKLVFINIATLNTLPDSQFAAGMGEVIKHGLIKDKAYYEWLLEHAEEIQKKEPAALRHTVWKQSDQACSGRGGSHGKGRTQAPEFRPYTGTCHRKAKRFLAPSRRMRSSRSFGCHASICCAGDGNRGRNSAL